VTRDDAFLLFELVLLGAAFLSFMGTILPATDAGTFAGRIGLGRSWRPPGTLSGYG
jgi:hypothetical protein